jgi:hypothetical protein
VRELAFLSLVLAAACASMTRPTDARPVAAVAPAAASAPATVAPSKPGADLREGPVARAAQAPAEAPAVVPGKARLEAVASPKPAARTSATPAPAAAKADAAKADAAPHLDLKGLEQRLKETSAIGILTKLALKNQVDDLLARFRAYHDGRQPPTLTDLRPSYELLIMKVQSLLQKDEPVLAEDVARSREVIWGMLADKGKFTTI